MAFLDTYYCHYNHFVDVKTQMLTTGFVSSGGSRGGARGALGQTEAHRAPRPPPPPKKKKNSRAGAGAPRNLGSG